MGRSGGRADGCIPGDQKRVSVQFSHVARRLLAEIIEALGGNPDAGVHHNGVQTDMLASMVSRSVHCWMSCVGAFAQSVQKYNSKITPSKQR